MGGGVEPISNCNTDGQKEAWTGAADGQREEEDGHQGAVRFWVKSGDVQKGLRVTPTPPWHPPPLPPLKTFSRPPRAAHTFLFKAKPAAAKFVLKL